jgi:hypothetical protein
MRDGEASWAAQAKSAPRFERGIVPTSMWPAIQARTSRIQRARCVRLPSTAARPSLSVQPVASRDSGTPVSQSPSRSVSSTMEFGQTSRASVNPSPSASGNSPRRSGSWSEARNGSGAKCGPSVR